MVSSQSSRSEELLAILSGSIYEHGTKGNYLNVDEINWVKNFNSALLCYVNSYSNNTQELLSSIDKLLNRKAKHFFHEFCIAFITFMGRCKPAGTGQYMPYDDRCKSSQLCCEHLVSSMIYAQPNYINSRAYDESDSEKNSERYRCPEWRHDLAWYAAARIGMEHKTLLQKIAGISLKYLYDKDKWMKALIDDCIRQDLVRKTLQFALI